MELSTLQEQVREVTAGIEHPRLASALALAEECGEVMRCVLDGEVYGKANAEALAAEIGDTLMALTEVSIRFDVDLDACAGAALAKIRAAAPGWREELGGRLERLRERMDAPL